MQEQNLSPAPKGRLEKLQAANVPNSILGVILVFAALRLQEHIGFLLAVAATIPVVVAASLVFEALVAPSKKRRIAKGAERGLFECAQREQGSAFKRRWAFGYAEAQPGKILFQAKTGVIGSVAGPVASYSEPRIVDDEVRAPWMVYPRGRVVAVSTDQGSIEIAASSSSIKLLIERTAN